MAKVKAVVKVEAAPIAVVKPAVLPSLAGASPEIQSRMLEIKDNLESIEAFRLPRAKMTASGFELIEGEKPVLDLEGVLVHTRKTNVYYAKPYNPNDLTPPDCSSANGITPDKSVESPVHATCQGCPMAEFGTNTMQSGKACRNLKPLYLLLADEAIMPRQVTITPSSLKAANQYLMNLTERGLSYRKVKTRITAFKAKPQDTFYTLRFSMGRKLTEQEIKDTEFLRNQWLPVMNNQVVEQGEFDKTQATPQASGEY